LRIVKAWFLIAVPFGFTVIVLRLLQSIWRDAGDLIAGRPAFTGRKLFD
jgi:TRAP-type C4-dicarboxylate transport system permease small subunit